VTVGDLALVVVLINEVALRPARLVPGWVTAINHHVDAEAANPDLLSLAITAAHFRHEVRRLII